MNTTGSVRLLEMALSITTTTCKIHTCEKTDELLFSYSVDLQVG